MDVDVVLEVGLVGTLTELVVLDPSPLTMGKVLLYTVTRIIWFESGPSTCLLVNIAIPPHF
jgi:hypothetical protein